MTLKLELIKYKRAAKESLELLKPLWISLHHHHAEVAPQLGSIRSEEESWQTRRGEYVGWLELPANFIILAEFDKQFIGYAFVRVREGKSATWNVSQQIGEIETLSILPEYRGFGVGVGLLEHVYVELKKDNVYEASLGVIATNQAAIRFYEKQGFETSLQYMNKRLQ